MMSFAADRILAELHAHHHDKAGFDRQDFDLLGNEERQELADTFLALVEDRAALAVQLQWLFGDQFATTIERRMEELPFGAPALVYLPCRLHQVTGEASYLATARAEIARGCMSWGSQTRNVLFFVRQTLWHDPVFPDLSRHLIIHYPERAVKEDAMEWLTQEKGYRPTAWRDDPELRRCLRGMLCRDAPSARALAILDRLHIDTGTVRAAATTPSAAPATKLERAAKSG
ncbi:hypothetical protein [uncultured Massilia sp.]|uniref:hypothetical protein n=1 Tax=uncultured Massilia sp. TaxID=169973 RepID=UPI002583D10C|nr:hypothetical protein [uncultured Massilia sp.]